MRSPDLICEYSSALSNTTKLLFWYLLAQGMDRNEIIPMPDKYQLEPQSAECLAQLEALDYSEQITVLRDFVSGMGIETVAASNAPKFTSL